VTVKGEGKHPRVTSPGGRRWLWRALAVWAGLFGLWMLLAGSVAASEIVVGLLAAAIAAAAVEVVRRQGLVRFRPDPRWLLRVRFIPWRTVREFAMVTGALGRSLLGRRVVGRFIAVDAPVRGSDGRSVARRALMAVGASVAPNSYVVDFDRQGGRIIVHQLVPPYAKQIEDVVP
jgi:multisubunit Na+/H+ antiporter MnhE subunit